MPELAMGIGTVAPADRRWYMGRHDPVYMVHFCVLCHLTKAYNESDMVLAQRDDGKGKKIKCRCGGEQFELAWLPLSVILKPDDDE